MNVKTFFDELGKRIKSFMHNITLTIALAIAFIFFIFAQDKFYFMLFTFIFTFTIYKILEKMSDIKHILAFDLKNNEVALIQISQKRLNNYNVVDSDGKNATINYKLRTKAGDIIIADGISTKKKVIVVNDIISNIDFLRNYKDVDMILKDRVKHLENELITLKAKMEYEALKHAGEIYERHPIIRKILEADTND